VILRMKALGMGEVVEFPFVEPPESRFIRDGYDTLLELGAVDERGELTGVGRDLARLPIDPRIGRMILGGQAENSLAEVLVIAAALSIQDPRERPLDRQEARIGAQEVRARGLGFSVARQLVEVLPGAVAALSHSKLRKACLQNFLSPTRMREWDDVYKQLHGQVADMGST